MSSSEARMSKVKMMVVCATCIALAVTLNQISLFRMPLGGSVTPFSMLFIVLAGYWLGPTWGIFTGVAMGLLNASLGATVHPYNPILSFVFDYPVAFGALGISGFFRKMKHGLQTGYVIGVLGRFASVFFVGFIVWGGMLQDWSSPGVAAWFSVVYNATYIVPEMIATLLVISLPTMKHALDNVTKSIVPPAEYALLTQSKGSASVNSKITTGAVFGAIGGFAFVLASYIQRLENLSIQQVITGAELFLDAPRADRLYRMVERNTGQLLALQTVGVILITICIALLVSTLVQNSKQP